jgi:hypothetical protein
MEPIERTWQLSRTTGDPEGPKIHWQDKRDAPTLEAAGLCAIGPGGRLYFTRVTVLGSVPVGSDELRAVPITAMLTLANGRARDDIFRELAKRGDPAAAALYTEPPDVVAKEAPLVRPAMRFDIPEGARKPDSFYAAVASAYVWLTEQEGSRRPAQDIAEANSTETNRMPVTTVRRWIREARRRELLRPGVRGRAGL